METLDKQEYSRATAVRMRGRGEEGRKRSQRTWWEGAERRAMRTVFGWEQVYREHGGIEALRRRKASGTPSYKLTNGITG